MSPLEILTGCARDGVELRQQTLEAIDITPEPSPATSGKGSDKSAFLDDDE